MRSQDFITLQPKLFEKSKSYAKNGPKLIIFRTQSRDTIPF